jgi:type II secretory pathway pseudopilin PulG
MAVLLVALSVMSIMLAVVMPVWKQTIRREKESELVFRGEQYIRAIRLFQSRYAAANPPSIDVLVEQRFLRKKYSDPITGGEFQVLTQTLSAPSGTGQQPGGRAGAGRGQAPGMMGAVGTARGGAIAGGSGGVIGVASKSTAQSLRLYNGRDHYNEWIFQYIARTAMPGGGVPGSATPGQVPGSPQMPGGPGGRGFGRGRGGFGAPGAPGMPGSPGASTPQPPSLPGR